MAILLRLQELFKPRLSRCKRCMPSVIIEGAQSTLSYKQQAMKSGSLCHTNGRVLLCLRPAWLCGLLHGSCPAMLKPIMSAMLCLPADAKHVYDEYLRELQGNNVEKELAQAQELEYNELQQLRLRLNQFRKDSSAHSSDTVQAGVRKKRGQPQQQQQQQVPRRRQNSMKAAGSNRGGAHYLGVVQGTPFLTQRVQQQQKTGSYASPEQQQLLGQEQQNQRRQGLQEEELLQQQWVVQQKQEDEVMQQQWAQQQDKADVQQQWQQYDADMCQQWERHQQQQGPQQQQQQQLQQPQWRQQLYQQQQSSGNLGAGDAAAVEQKPIADQKLELLLQQLQGPAGGSGHMAQGGSAFADGSAGSGAELQQRQEQGELGSDGPPLPTAPSGSMEEDQHMFHDLNLQLLYELVQEDEARMVGLVTPGEHHGGQLGERERQQPKGAAAAAPATAEAVTAGAAAPSGAAGFHPAAINGSGICGELSSAATGTGAVVPAAVAGAAGSSTQQAVASVHAEYQRKQLSVQQRDQELAQHSEVLKSQLVEMLTERRRLRELQQQLQQEEEQGIGTLPSH